MFQTTNQTKTYHWLVDRLMQDTVDVFPHVQIQSPLVEVLRVAVT